MLRAAMKPKRIFINTQQKRKREQPDPPEVRRVYREMTPERFHSGPHLYLDEHGNKSTNRKFKTATLQGWMHYIYGAVSDQIWAAERIRRVLPPPQLLGRFSRSCTYEEAVEACKRARPMV